ncbi:MAG: hypothetical protein F6K41_38310 [Symploca sp. SIO3E6]|nr:hypothetical protein [Caldora sp. SIO3E6]
MSNIRTRGRGDEGTRGRGDAETGLEGLSCMVVVKKIFSSGLLSASCLLPPAFCLLPPALCLGALFLKSKTHRFACNAP